MRIGMQAQEQSQEGLKVFQELQNRNDSIIEQEQEQQLNIEYYKALQGLGIQLN